MIITRAININLVRGLQAIQIQNYNKTQQDNNIYFPSFKLKN